MKDRNAANESSVILITDRRLRDAGVRTVIRLLDAVTVSLMAFVSKLAEVWFGRTGLQ